MLNAYTHTYHHIFQQKHLCCCNDEGYASWCSHPKSFWKFLQRRKCFIWYKTQIKTSIFIKLHGFSLRFSTYACPRGSAAAASRGANYRWAPTSSDPAATKRHLNVFRALSPLVQHPLASNHAPLWDPWLWGSKWELEKTLCGCQLHSNSGVSQHWPLLRTEEQWVLARGSVHFLPVMWGHSASLDWCIHLTYKKTFFKNNWLSKCKRIWKLRIW